MKEFPITIGFDDATFELKTEATRTQLIGVICQGVRIVSVLGEEITIDGDDATDRLVEMVKQVKNHVQYILTDTITFGGFNIVNMERIHEETKKPVIAVTERKINLDSVRTALVKKYPTTYKQKLANIVSAGNLYEMEIMTAGGRSEIYYHCKGIKPLKVKRLLKRVCIDSKLPEPVRIAHIIGKLFAGDR
ncbi:MAG: DUF99 family protein [Promethearchaeia archaeon]